MSSHVFTHLLAIQCMFSILRTSRYTVGHSISTSPHAGEDIFRAFSPRGKRRAPDWKGITISVPTLPSGRRRSPRRRCCGYCDKSGRLSFNLDSCARMTIVSRQNHKPLKLMKHAFLWLPLMRKSDAEVDRKLQIVSRTNRLGVGVDCHHVQC